MAIEAPLDVARELYRGEPAEFVAARDRHVAQAHALRRPPPTLPGDDLIPTLYWPHRQRLQDAALADAFHQRVHLGFVEVAAGLTRAGPQGDQDLPAAYPPSTSR